MYSIIWGKEKGEWLNIENKMYVVFKNNKTTLKFPKCNIEEEAFIGKNGMTKDKEEGDGKTPVGEFNLGLILGTHKNEKNINGLEYIQITEDMYWVDDIKSKYYNKLVSIRNVEKDWNSAEHLIEYPVQYEYLLEIKTNPKNISGKGSRDIFALHKL